MFDVAQPWFLLLWLVLAGLCLLWGRRSLAGLSPAQARLCLAVRLLILLCITLALAGVRLLLPDRSVTVLYALDGSASISEEARAEGERFIKESLATPGAGRSAGLVNFAAKPEFLPQPPAAWPLPADRTATSLGEALTFSAAMLPAAGARRIVLLSDGNDTTGQARASAQRLAAAGIEIWPRALRNSAKPEVVVSKVEAPRRLKSGEPFNVLARLHSNIATAVRVRLYCNQFLADERRLDLQPGETLYRAENQRAEGTFVTCDVEIVPEADTVAENNRASAAISFQGEPSVLIIDPRPADLRPLADVLRAEKINVELREPAGLPSTTEELQNIDLLLLSDISALQLGAGRMDLYRQWVRDFGGGFAMLGGDRSFGMGGYYGTPIEQMLPVGVEHEDRMDTPTVALLVILDRSGSMTAQIQGQTKMSLANQGAVFAMRALQAKDSFGVLAVDTRAHTVVPLAPLTSVQAQEQKIMSVTAGGGGIYVYTSLAEAFPLLRDTAARIKHVILFSDAADAEEKYAGELEDGARPGGSALDLATAMLSARITTSVVALGSEQDKDTVFLRQLAERGQGRFYLTSDATSLPQIFSSETMRVAQSSLVEEPFLARRGVPSPVTDGIDWTASPLLLGYNATKPKPGADLLLLTERGEPLLAQWRFGLGQAAAFTSDAKNRWGVEWLGWPGYGKFWAQFIRGAMRSGGATGFQVQTQEKDGRLLVQIDAVTPRGDFQNAAPLQVHAVLPEGESTTAVAQQIAPGQYRAEFPQPPLGTSVFSVRSATQPDSSYTFGYTRSYPEEYLRTAPDLDLLRTLADATRGRSDPAPADVWKSTGSGAPSRRDLTPWFLIAALCLLPLDIFLRRRAWSA